MNLPAWSLRSKLIAACLLLQFAGSVLLVSSSSKLLQKTLADQAIADIGQVAVLLDQAIAVPLAQRDYATLEQTFKLIRRDDFINYLVLRDHRGTVVASSGWDDALPLPPQTRGELDLNGADATMHHTVPIRIGDQVLGEVALGLSTKRLQKVRTEFLVRSIGIGVTVLTVSTLALAIIAFAITRHLTQLARASMQVANGDLDVRVPIETRDEIAHVGASFNAMAAALKQRINALQESEAQQGILLNAVREQQARLASLLGAINSGILFVGAEGQLLYANAAFQRIWSLPDELSGRHISTVIPMLTAQTAPAYSIHLDAMLHMDIQKVPNSFEVRTLDEKVITIRAQLVTPNSIDGGCIWFHDDVTHERRIQQRAHQALHDPLTRLLNRRGFQESFRAEIARSTIEGIPLSLMYVDLDNFKQVNDFGGHHYGDEVLVMIANTLAEQMRRGEIVARLGGDEFAIVCPGIGVDAASLIATRIVDAIGRLGVIASTEELKLGCSVGISTYPTDADNEYDLIDHADAAMYRAKQQGKNCWVAYCTMATTSVATR